jgi:hemerythrin-like domain-containing protein
MAGICNDEQGFFGVMSGHDRNTLSLIALAQRLKAAITMFTWPFFETSSQSQRRSCRSVFELNCCSRSMSGGQRGLTLYLKAKAAEFDQKSKENMMSSTHSTLDPVESMKLQDGFDILDVCHRKTVFMLGKLAALITRLTNIGADAEARAMAAEIVGYFSTTARQHHEDEERHVFPKLATDGDPAVVHAVLRLQQDHDWLEENWMELLPHLDAVACGQSWYDVDFMREAAKVFTGLSHDHIALEESYIYPQARAQLRLRERIDMGREMAARRRDQRVAAKAG